MTRFTRTLSIAAFLALTACGGTSSSYDDAFTKLYNGQSDGFASVRSNEMVQVGAESGAPQMHYATNVTLPGAITCFTEGDGAEAYAACIVAENAPQGDADRAFSDQQKQAASAAASLKLQAAPTPTGVKAAAWTGASRHRVLVIEQPADSGKATVTVLFGAH